MIGKKSVKLLLRRAAVYGCCVVLALLSVSGPVMAGSDGSPDGFDSWDDYFNSFLNGGSAEIADVPPLEEMTVAAENKQFKMYFYENGLDFHVLDKRTQKLWSTAIHPDYMDTTDKSPDKYTSLLNVALANTADGVSHYNLTDSGNEEFQVSSSQIDNGVTLSISIPVEKVSFELRFVLEESGFSVTLPEDSISCNGAKQLLNVDFLPQFGAAKVGEAGYIFYPDGEGALIDIRKNAYPMIQSYSYPLYGMSNPDVDIYTENTDQDIKNLMLPVFGIKHGNGGFLAVAEQGDADASFMMEIHDSYNAWFRFDYSRYISASFNYTGNAAGDIEVNKLLDKRAEGDRTVKYFLLEGEESTYSDMATVYRDWLESQGVLKRLEKTDTIPLSVELFMSISKDGILGNHIETLTSYKQAADITSDLADAQVKGLQVLLSGWTADGYEAMPTQPQYSTALGGASGFRGLANICEETGAELLANFEYVLGNSEHGSYNGKNDVLRNLVGLTVEKDGSPLVFMNPVKSLLSDLKAAIKKSKGEWQISLSNVGNLALPSVYEKDISYRYETVAAYTEALKLLQTNQETVSVSGGNAYVLPYADRLYGIPDSDSKYLQNSRSVPFYQMVVHGFVEYTSLAGNRSGNQQIQKLRWIETGSIPHYELTSESPVALRGTTYDQLFSSEYSQWKNIMLDTYKEFNERLSSVWHLRMVEHQQLSSDVVCITYENGAKTYINYGSDDTEIDGIKLPAEEYVVVQKN